ncbi:Ig-like domain-containing protein [Mycobacterium sp. C31M]
MKTAAQPDAAPSLGSFLTAIFDTIRREITTFWVNLQRHFAPRKSEQVQEPSEEEPGAVVDPVPTVTDDAFSGVVNAAITGNVLINDIVPVGSPASALLESQPASGMVTLNADGTFIYVPSAGFHGTDVFQYRAYAGSLASPVLASVTITVTPASIPGDPPFTLPTVGIQGLSWWIGLSKQQIDDALTKAKAANVTSVRMDFSWSVIEWQKGTYDWSSTDTMVDAVRAHGMTALAMVYDTPAWLSGSTDPHAIPVGSEQIQQFAEFAAAAALRYGDVIPEWEVWNEQNIPRFWAVPDAAAYTALLKATYTAIKAVSPGATVIAGGLSPDPSGIGTLDFVRGIYAAGGKGYFDALNYHHYAFPSVPDMGPLAAIHEIMVTNGDGDKKIWITEAGAPTGTGTYAVSEQVQADTIVAILNQAAENTYIGPVYIYTITDTGTDLSDPESNFGLITQDGRLKPAYQALLDFMTRNSSAAAATVSA